MKIDDLFPRKYATGADLDGKAATLTISRTALEEMRPNRHAPPVKKLIVYFQGATKGVIVGGRILAEQIAAVVGSRDTDHWPGSRVTLYPQPMTVAGKPRIAIRARKPADSPPPLALQEDDDF